MMVIQSEQSSRSHPTLGPAERKRPNRHIRLALHTVNNMRINRNKNTRNQHMLLAPETKPAPPCECLNRDWNLCGMIGQKRAAPYLDNYKLPPSVSQDGLDLAILIRC
jgi:hypothetical protein